MGVPQGSILGPLLFLLYVNDLPNASSVLSFIQFADDTSLFIKGKSLHDMSTLMNEQLTIVTEWLKINKLSLNISKTKYMIMTSRGKKYNDNTCEILIDGKVIDCVSEFRFLGIVIDNYLTWKSHIAHVCNKVSKLIGIFFKTRKILDTDTLVMLYNTLVKPYFTYCIIIWGNSFKSYLHRVEVLQKKLLRILTFSLYNAHTQPLFRRWKIMEFNQLYTYLSSVHIFKCIYHLLPNSFWDEFRLCKSTRNSHNQSIARNVFVKHRSVTVATMYEIISPLK